MIKRILLILSISVLLASIAFGQGTTGISSTPAAATEKPAKAPIFRPTKDQIKQGQSILKDKKLYAGDATGVYNDDTRNALKTYQKDNGLDANGKFDKATLEKMGVATEKVTTKSATSGTQTSPSSVKRPAPFRADADQIKAAQKVLKDGKMYSGDETGTLDDATRAALKKYQEANGLRVMGSLNAATLEKMGIALTEKQKEQVAAQAAYDASKKN